jgi:ribosome biogenesis GTPase A
VPGTTVGVIKVDGVLEGRAKLYDTPGILNPSQITTRLNRDEQRLAQINKPLRPRTYRIKVSGGTPALFTSRFLSWCTYM